MIRTLSSVTATTLLLSTPLHAEISTDTLQIYAAMAKIEANMAEAAGAVILAAAAQGDAEILAEAKDDYASDLAQIGSYAAFLQSASLNDEQKTAVDTLVAEWTPIAAAGTALLNEDDDAIRGAAFEWWESLDGLDDIVDDQLEAILDNANATILE